MSSGLNLAKRRLMSDFKKITSEKPEGISASPCEGESALYHWHAFILGPENSLWEGGVFKLDMTFDDDYPNHPPKVRFITPIFHPNVYPDGSICLDILQSQWSAMYDIAAVLVSIRSLLTDPNPASPANAEAARIYKEDICEYNRRVTECVQQSWRGTGFDSDSDSDEETSDDDDDDSST